jgi:GNAT superfamily N-acetyltransferase
MTESRVYLAKTATGKLVEASLLDEVADRHLAMWERSWRPAMEAHCEDRTWSDKPEDHHWDWKAKADEWRPLLGYHSFAIVCENDLQGLMLVSDFKSARLRAQFGRPVVYVEFVATAPWNRPEVQRPPRYRGVGTVMMMACVGLSRELGYHGRIGLHSLPAACPFYRDRIGMTELGEDAAHQDLTYFEMTRKQAEAFLQKE